MIRQHCFEFPNALSDIVYSLNYVSYEALPGPSILANIVSGPESGFPEKYRTMLSDACLGPL